MWMGRASPRCSACQAKGKPGPWCLADRPCTFQSVASAGNILTSVRTSSNLGRRAFGSTGSPCSPVGSLGSTSSSPVQQNRHAPMQHSTSSTLQRSGSERDCTPSRSFPPTPDGGNRRISPTRTPSTLSAGGRAPPPTSSAGRASVSRGGPVMSPPSSRSPGAVSRFHQSSREETEKQRDAEFQKELDMLRVVLNTQSMSWAQVKVAANQLLSNGRGTGGGADMHFHQLIDNATEQSSRLQSLFEQVIEGKTKGKENPQSASASGWSYIQGECERLCQEKAEMTRTITELHLERDQMAKTMADRTSELQAELNRVIEENNKMTKDIEELHVQRQQLVEKMAEVRAECERTIAEGRREMSQQTGAFYAECARTIEGNTAEMTRQLAEFQAERDRLEKEKQDMIKKMSEARAEGERKMAQEEAELAKKMAKLRDECERKIAEEVAAADRRLAESRKQTEEKLRKERQVTNHIMHVLHELPPLQTAMELGDLGLLEQELSKWKIDLLPDHFGECKGVVEAVLKLARERLVAWRGVEHAWRDVLKEVEHLPSSLVTLTRQSQRIFRTLKESQLTMLDLNRSDPKAMERICEVLLAWQERSMAHSNHVQKLIVRKVVTCRQLGAFDFADLDICLRFVDREGPGSEIFLSRAKALVDDEKTSPQQLRALLAHLETMLFFLKYTASEDLQLTFLEFAKQASPSDPQVMEYFKFAQQVYSPGSELVRVSDGRDLFDKENVANVLKELRTPRRRMMGMAKDNLEHFREIFYQWAVAMHSTFNLLVLPHHTQVVTLLAFQKFLESSPAPHALIAQVGTGEGKSMIIAALAIYVAVVLRKQVHVVVDDETLLERDFGTFKRVFDAFDVSVPPGNGNKRKLSAVLCVSEERLAGKVGQPWLVSRVDPEADICYCEAKHVQSFYASIARSDRPDFSSYKDRVLILDEVDALVIDEEPNDVFVYVNDELSRLATTMAEALSQGRSAEELAKRSAHPAAARVADEMIGEWTRGKKMVAGEDFVFAKEIGKYCALQAGRANPKAWSLALECRNFQDGLGREIILQERLFVASRPRVFRKYHRIVGLSGSIGSKPEQHFLRETYRAAFFKVPPFLTTCRGSPFHEAVPVRLGQRRRVVYVEPSQDQQISRIAEVALDARDRIPVLVIAKDRTYAEQIVERLRQLARSRGLGALSEDVVRSLSRTLYEANPEQWKENLNRATMALGDGEGGGKSWRITITDPRGARGTDYRVDDQAVDVQGGLLLICTVVPSSRREWTQFLGRTARQDCKGQYCCVLNAADYQQLSQKHREPLPTDGADGGVSVIESILKWGDREADERIRGSAALYNCGVRMNELCEEVFGKRPELLRDPAAREHLVEACQRFRWMSRREVDEVFARLPRFESASVPSEASNFVRPSEPVSSSSGAVASSSAARAPAVVLFCLDWSTSMLSRDTGTRLTRFETCVSCVLRILREQVRDCDSVGVVCFGPNVQLVVPPTPKSTGKAMIESRISGLRAQSQGGTQFYDAVAYCLQLLGKPNVCAEDAKRWLICLTDGDDLGSQPRNTRGELVTQMLLANGSKHLNLLGITVGPMKPINTQIINSWVTRVASGGGVGKLLQESNAATIAKAFDVVAEYLAKEVGGAVEC